MSVKTILVSLTTEENTPDLLQAAGVLARRTGAHVIGLHTIEAVEVYPGIAMHIDAAAHESFNAAQTAQAAAIRTAFETFAADPDIAAEWRQVRAQSTIAADRIVESAFAADLVIMAQGAGATDRPDQRGAQEDVIRRAGRPVLVIPTGYKCRVLGERIVVGWSATSQSARAAHDALEIAAPGAEMHVLVADAPSTSMHHETAVELAAAIARRGLAADLIDQPTIGRTIAATLLDAADEHQADMIVTGAFGHSRIYDFVIGAVTFELLETMRRPVLFSR